ncbi:MAG: hypothetical protein CVV27_05810 [Candidatus Melainabacteria bacterium HGW-Melainabacteria-1]|nr:MAG: hypothetical protein CVV27_05810 [Candidatus Melainabacteria bacterium HGW-Melainabacteria-1]
MSKALEPENVLRMCGQDFKIASATISAGLGDPHWQRVYGSGEDQVLCWSVRVECEDTEFEDTRWKPSADADCFRLPIRSWKELEGTSHGWETPFDEDDEPYGNFYVFEHADIGAAKLNIGQRRDVSFELRWDGICDIFWSDEIDQNVPFSIRAWARFDGVRVQASEKESEAEVLARISQWLDLRDFEPGPYELAVFTYQDGVKPADFTLMPINA